MSGSGRAYAYPVRILDFHEIINEEIDGLPLLITYCPLCRSGVVYDRRLAGRELTGAELEPVPSSMATWRDWLERHPDTLVLSTDTGFSRPYDRDPSEGFRARIDAGHRPFPDAEASVRDDRLDDGEEVVGVVLDGLARAYPLRRLGDAAVNDELAGTALVVFSGSDGPTGRVFERRLDGEELTSAYAGDGHYRDHGCGSLWDRDGRAVEGPMAGTQLDAVPSRSSFWFAFVASFPETEVSEGP